MPKGPWKLILSKHPWAYLVHAKWSGLISCLPSLQKCYFNLSLNNFFIPFILIFSSDVAVLCTSDLHCISCNSCLCVLSLTFLVWFSKAGFWCHGLVFLQCHFYSSLFLNIFQFFSVIIFSLFRISVSFSFCFMSLNDTCFLNLGGRENKALSLNFSLE